MKTLLKAFLSLAFIGGIFSPALAQKQLTGEISGNFPAGDYLISGDVVVLPKTMLSFAPGSKLRFENYTGIMVKGKLVCNGTPQQPIIFTSARDVPKTKALPEAFDWNGIKVTFEAEGVSLEHCTFAYSTFGLDIESNTTPVSIKNVSFIHNGSASLTRGKTMIPVQETTPVSYRWPEAAGAAAGANVQAERPADSIMLAAKPSLGPVSAEKADKKGRGQRVRRATFAVLAAGSVVTGVLFQRLAASRYDDYMAERSYDFTKHDADWQLVAKAESSRNFFYLLAGLCTAGCAISIPF